MEKALEELHNVLSRKWSHIYLYRADTLEQVQQKMKELRDWPEENAKEAVASLDEGGNELLTLITIGLPTCYRRHFNTTNIFESIVASIKSKTRHVKNWKRSPHQVARWPARLALDAEQGRKR